MEYEYYVEVIRFKRSGKYYDTVSFGTNSNTVNEVIDEITNILSQDFDYLITGEGFPDGQGYPHLVKCAGDKL